MKFAESPWLLNGSSKGSDETFVLVLCTVKWGELEGCFDIAQGPQTFVLCHHSVVIVA